MVRREGRRRSPGAQATRSLASVTLAIMLIHGLGGCATTAPTIDELAKALEHNAYDQLGDVFSGFCARAGHAGPFVDHTRIELSREIRQNGSHGPLPPGPAAGGIAYKRGDRQLLDDGTRYGRGPVVVIYCETDEVPEAVWRRLDRYWKD